VVRSRWLLVAALALAVVGVWGLAAALLLRGEDQPAPTDIGIASPAPSLTVAPPPVSPSASATPSPTPSPSPTPTPRPTPAPTRTPTRTEPAGDDARLRFAEFGLRLRDAATEVQALNRALTQAVQAQDDPATTAAAVDMLDFVDRQRDWLAGNPPAACYAAAHEAAGAMLRDYAAVADAALEYAAARGLDRLEAFAIVAERAEAAGGALTDLQDALEAATCLA
jgi:hypothetical protein